MIGVIQIGDKIVDKKLLTAKFACNVDACKGACCTFPGGFGPPILPEEMSILRKAFEIVRERLPQEHVSIVDEGGLIAYYNKMPSIRCHKKRACVFVAYEDGVAKCSIQNAYLHNEIGWMKPQSCHLFPLRVTGRNRDILRFEEFSECKTAFKHGKARGIYLIDFLEDAISRVFGEDFYFRLKEEAAQIMVNSAS